MDQALLEEKIGLFYQVLRPLRAAVPVHGWYAIRILHQAESPNIAESYPLGTLG